MRPTPHSEREIRRSFLLAADGEQAEAPKRIPLMRLGKWEIGPDGGRGFEFTEADRLAVIANYQALEHKQIPIDIEHVGEADPTKVPDPVATRAVGWITGVAAEGEYLYGEVDWTPEGTELVTSKKFKFISPGIVFRRRDTKSGKQVGAYLRSAAICTHPFVDMPPLMAAEGDDMADKGKGYASIEEAMADLPDMAEALSAYLTKTAEGWMRTVKAAAVAGAPAVPPPVEDENKPKDPEEDEMAEIKATERLADVQAKLTELVKANEAQAAELTRLREQECDRLFAGLVETGRAKAAQKDAFLKRGRQWLVELAELIPEGTYPRQNGQEIGTAGTPDATEPKDFDSAFALTEKQHPGMDPRAVADEIERRWPHLLTEYVGENVDRTRPVGLVDLGLPATTK